jgi:hypothetical protein
MSQKTTAQAKSQLSCLVSLVGFTCEWNGGNALENAVTLFLLLH